MKSNQGNIYLNTNGRFLLETCREIQRCVSVPKELEENLECALGKLEAWLNHYEIPEEELKHMVFRTFQEWSDMNYHVKKGEKSLRRNEKGEPLFHDLQVVPYNSIRFSNKRSSGDDENEFDDWYRNDTYAH